MCKNYIICLCFSEDHCRETTKEIAKRNNAIDWFIEPVFAPPIHYISYGPIRQQIAYRGTIVKEIDDINVNQIHSHIRAWKGKDTWYNAGIKK